LTRRLVLGALRTPTEPLNLGRIRQADQHPQGVDQGADREIRLDGSVHPEPHTEAEHGDADLLGGDA
jgi:hypothetical protein